MPVGKKYENNPLRGKYEKWVCPHATSPLFTVNKLNIEKRNNSHEMFTVFSSLVH